MVWMMVSYFVVSFSADNVVVVVGVGADGNVGGGGTGSRAS